MMWLILLVVGTAFGLLFIWALAHVQKEKYD